MFLTGIDFGKEHGPIHDFTPNHYPIDEVQLFLDLLGSIESSINRNRQMWEILRQLEDTRFAPML